MLGFSKHLIASSPPGIGFASVQIGQVIITPETVWTNSFGYNVFGLLLADGSSFDGVAYPLLAIEYPSLSLPNIPTESNSPFPYMVVADLVGE